MYSYIKGTLVKRDDEYIVIDSMQKWGKEYKRLRKLMERYG